MIRRIYVLLIFTGMVLFYSCNNTGQHNDIKSNDLKNKIRQKEDGSISLNVDKADCYHDRVNPSTNTAEWNVLVSKSGRFDVWLSSATMDTTDLKYDHSVLLSILDNRLEARPACDKIVRNSSDVSYPYFRADSFIGSLYIQDTGLYNIQIISEKIIPRNTGKEQSEDPESSKLLSVFLKPISR